MGNVYFILDPESHAVKIGYSGSLRLRFNDLNVASPHRLELAVAVPGTMDDEKAMHRLVRQQQSLAGKRPLTGEWFHWDLITHELMERAKAGATIEDLLGFQFTRLPQFVPPYLRSDYAKQIEEQLA